MDEEYDGFFGFTASEVSEMLEEGVTDIIKVGIAFSGKKVKIRTE